MQGPHPSEPRDHELVDVRVRMPAIDEAFTVAARVELTVGHRDAFRIERGGECTVAVRERSAKHGHDLRQHRLRNKRAAGRWVGARDERDRLHHHVHAR